MSELIVTTADVDLALVCLDQNPAVVYLASLESAQSRRTMRGALDQAADLLASGATVETFPWSRLRYAHVAALRSRLAETRSYATVNKMLSAVRRVAKEAWRLGQVDAETYQRIADVGNVKGSTLPAGRAVSPEEIAALMNACAKDDTPAGVRDAAIFGVLYACGLRRAEVVMLSLIDYDPTTGALVVRGKRNKERIVYIINGAADALTDWIESRGDRPEALFLPIRRGGHIKPGRLSTQAVYHILTKRAEQAGIKGASPHDFRRTFVGDLLDAGADIATVQRLAGHANVQTTARYDRRPEAAKRKAAGLLHVPYRRRGPMRG